MISSPGGSAINLQPVAGACEPRPLAPDDLQYAPGVDGLLETLVNQTLSETAVPVKDWPQHIGFSAIFSNKAVARPIMNQDVANFTES
jgi:hypothetical protein